ncbi:4Fe-4S dicluster protein [Hydrogenispora ethanolica]|uniref:4Fe-4S dicluster protein n=1 Tax=Hydrogenispora ethanolica TaxID=1082276 RepID=A0A4R1RVM2_HYDET|nr:4Fe-4S double cluster binding domain-containing protein [Hydrogenispora ethanolica]TCL70705.1 4Fe-4S dicluster protein [Hydrogenispora ethanolica]
MELLEQIKQLAGFHAIDFIGVAGIAAYHDQIEAIGGTLSRDYPRAIAIGIVLQKSIVRLLNDRGTYENVFQYQHHYDVTNARLDHFAAIVSSVIQRGGYPTLPVPAAERIDSERVCASVSHKIVARLAGFGWIGKNCLLINPDYGPGIRWTTVLTAAPLPENLRVSENRCGDCRQCVKACPAQAIKGRNYYDGEPRDRRLDVSKCEAYFDALEKAGKLRVCGMCLQACPYGRKTP